MATRKTGTSIQHYSDWTTLGAGGMATVYRAKQPSLDRDVAIKELKPEFARDPGVVQRFEREARYSAKLQHESIVHVYDYVKEAGSHYIVMEFVDGTDLGRIIKQVGALPPDVAALFAARIARGLEHAHARGIIHRDIKPGNVLVSRMGEVKLSDFGIAKDPLNPSDDMTRTGQAVGTPSYMSPEQIVGDPLDFRTDLFAFGILLYELLTGEKPFKADTASSLLERIRTQGYVDVRTARKGVPRVLARVVRRCLKKEPKKRFGSTEEVRRTLEKWALRQIRVSPEEHIHGWLVRAGVFVEEPTKVVPSGTTKVPVFARAKRLRLAAGAALVATLAGIGAVALGPGWRGRSRGPALPSPDGPLASPSWTPPEEAMTPAPTPLDVETAIDAVRDPTPEQTTQTGSETFPAPASEVEPSTTGVEATATPAQAATPAPQPSPTPASTSAPTPRLSPTPTPKPSPTPTPKPSPTPTPKPSPTPTPKPSPPKTPAPRATPARTLSPKTAPAKSAAKPGSNAPALSSGKTAS